jgi:hypothetical protein
VRCEVLGHRLSGVVDDPRFLEAELLDASSLPARLATAGLLDDDQARHVAQCLRCQADLAQFRRIRRVMAAMRAERFPVPPGLVADVLARLDDTLERRARHRRNGRRAACLGGLAAVTAAGVGGALVLASRRRAA